MINHSVLDNSYSGQSTVLRLADKALTPLAISTGHRTSADGKTYNLAIRILAGLAAVLIAPITLIALAVKWYKMPPVEANKKETVVEAPPVKEVDPTPTPTPAPLPRQPQIELPPSTEPLPKPESQPKPESLPKPQPEPEPLPKPELQPEPLPKPEPLAKPEPQPEPKPEPQKVEVSVQKTLAEATQQILAELENIQKLDVKLGAPRFGSWRAHGAQNGEINQKIDLFTATISDMGMVSIPDQRTLHIQRIGDFSDMDLRIIDITCDFLKVIHGVSAKIHDKTITMEQLAEKYLKALRKNHESEHSKIYENLGDDSDLAELQSKIDGLELRQRQEIDDHLADLQGKFPKQFPKQFEADKALDFMKLALQPALATDEDDSPQLIGFTSEDLYTQEMQFVYGSADCSGVGIWSNARFGNPKESSQDFERCLLRMMKISAHEFAHMRHMLHCTDYDCNIGGYMNVIELDERPLLYCAQDTAKICYLGQTSILEYEKKQLAFFENFNATYKLNIDLSKEIGILNARIKKLEQAAV